MGPDATGGPDMGPDRCGVRTRNLSGPMSGPGTQHGTRQDTAAQDSTEQYTAAQDSTWDPTEPTHLDGVSALPTP